jgi:hypothetical protein
MRYRSSHLFVAFLALSTACGGALPQSTERVVTACIDGEKTSVIAFLPPSMQDSRDKGAAAAQERVSSAIENTKLCLGNDYVSYRVVFAERIVVRSLAGEETFEVGHFAPLVGALLLRPGSNARIIFAGGGPEALAQLLHSAASEYFGKRCEGN